MQIITNSKCYIQGPVEADPEYQLIVEANNLAVEIDNDVIAIHKFVRDLYKKTWEIQRIFCPKTFHLL